MNHWTQIKRDDIEFHKTFQPTESYITKIMELAGKHYAGTKEEISSMTGIPTGKTSGKVIPHIRYAKYMGLVDYEKVNAAYHLSLTPLGEIVFQQDPYLFEDITKWICHYHMTDPDQGAYLWAFLYHVLPFQLDMPISNELIARKNEETWGKKFDLGVVKRTYMEGCFSTLRALDWNDGLTFQHCYYSSELKYVYAYTLLNCWEHYFPTKQELTVYEIESELKWSRRFGMDETEMMTVLDELEDEGILKLNRQLHPCTVIRAASASEQLVNLYAEII